MIKFNLELKKYYPLLIKSMLYVDIPKVHATMANWSLSIWNKMVKGASRDIKFISRDQLTDFVDWQLIPVEMGGPRMASIVIPANVKPLRELDHLKFTEKAYNVFNKHHESVLENIEKFSNSKTMSFMFNKYYKNI